MDARPRRRHAVANRAGYVAIALALLAVGGALSFRFPDHLTTPALRGLYPLEVLRLVLRLGLATAIALAVASVVLHPRRRFGWVALALSATALGLGAWSAPERVPRDGTWTLGLDWLVLDFFSVALVFVPLERAFARLRTQLVFREGWLTDVLHYATSHLLIGVTLLLITSPAFFLARTLSIEGWVGFVSGLPLWVQVPAAVLVADLTQYAVHRAFHQVPLLWRFHAIHHSSRQMDWLAGSRLHLVDIVATRGVTFVPLTLLGFSEQALQIYLVFIAAQAVFVHANVRFELRPLSWLLATPAVHHWHHSAEVPAPGCNFAVTLPVIDRVFGTLHLPPGRWPERYGTLDDEVPDGWWAQVTSPLFGQHR